MPAQMLICIRLGSLRNREKEEICLTQTKQASLLVRLVFEEASDKALGIPPYPCYYESATIYPNDQELSAQ